jgi:hypothetical protein
MQRIHVIAGIYMFIHVACKFCYVYLCCMQSSQRQSFASLICVRCRYTSNPSTGTTTTHYAYILCPISSCVPTSTTRSRWPKSIVQWRIQWVVVVTVANPVSSCCWCDWIAFSIKFSLKSVPCTSAVNIVREVKLKEKGFTQFFVGILVSNILYKH